MSGSGFAGILAALVAAFVLGMYAGYAFRDRSAAKAELKRTQATLATSQQAVDRFQRAMNDADAQFQTDAAALHGIAEDYAYAKQQQQVFYGALGARFDRYFEARPDLSACDLGPAGLQLWNDANRGAPARPGAGDPDASAAAGGSSPVAAVSESAAGTRRQAAHAHAQPQAGGGAVSRLSGAPRQADRNREGARSARGGAAPESARARRAAGHSRAALIETSGGDT